MQKICTNVKLIYYFSYMFISYLEFFIKIFYLLLIQFCFHIFLYCLRIPYIYIKKYAHIHSSFSSSNSHQISHNTSPPACLHHFSFYNSSKKKKKQNLVSLMMGKGGSPHVCFNSVLIVWRYYPGVDIDTVSSCMW